MKLDARVTDVSVKHQPRFNRDGTSATMAVYTYFVGTNGPFTLEYPVGMDTPEKVNMDIQAQVDKLTMLGIVKPLAG